MERFELVERFEPEGRVEFRRELRQCGACRLQPVGPKRALTRTAS